MGNGKTDFVSLAAVGDIYVNVGTYYGMLPEVLQRKEATSAFALALSFLKEQDIVLGNQECPLSKRGQPMPGKAAWFRSNPSAVEALVAADFDAVGLANNHALDFGVDALLDTIETLDKAGIGHAGAGRNIVEAHRPAIIEEQNLRLALLSYTSVFMPGWAAREDYPGLSAVKVNTQYQPPARFHEMPGMPPVITTSPDKTDLERMKLDIKNAKAQADIVVISWHWGRSDGGYRDVLDYQVELAHTSIDSGADFIFGHHAHAPAGIEIYKGKAIFYSMGNFALDVKHPGFAMESLIACCQIRNKRIERVSFVPVRINPELQPEVLKPEQGKDIVDLVERISQRFATRFSTEGNEVVIHTGGK